MLCFPNVEHIEIFTDFLKQNYQKNYAHIGEKHKYSLLKLFFMHASVDGPVKFSNYSTNSQRCFLFATEVGMSNKNYLFARQETQ